MLVNIAEWASDSLLAIWYSARAENGLFAGYDNLDASDVGSDSGMRRLRGGITFPMPLPEPATARTRGDGRTLANWQRNPDADNAYTLEVALNDQYAEVFFGGGRIHTFGYYRYLSVVGSTSKRQRDSILVLHRQGKTQETGGAGALNKPGYENLIVMSNQITPLLDDQVAQDETGNVRYPGIANNVSNFPWGESILEETDFSDGVVAHYFTEYPDMYHVIVGDGALTTITVDQPPVDDAVWRVMVIDSTETLATGSRVEATVSTVDPDTHDIDVSAPLTEDHVYVVVYQMAPEAL